MLRPRFVRRLATLFALVPVVASAQTAPTPGSCTLGRAHATLDVGDVRATFGNTGSLFYGNGIQGAYTVPKDTGRSPIYVASLWIGGKVGNELRVAGGAYGAPSSDFTFWPGPLGAGGTAPADCAAYDRIYTVAALDLLRYADTGETTADLRDWPAHLGAPVIDGDGVPGNYSLAGGDQPALRGDQMAWWLSNDVGNAHTFLATPPLGVEVRAEASAFAFGRLDRTTIYRYTVTNRTTATIDSAYVGMFVDADLGDAADDLVGTDTTHGVAYTYNVDNADGDGSPPTYGVPPPAVGVQVLAGPVGLPNGRDDDRDGETDELGERLGLTATRVFWGVPDASGDPNSGIEMYRSLRGLWNDGTVIRAFGYGYQQTQGDTTTFAFSGDPVRGLVWSEVNTGAGQNEAGDRRISLATGPFRLAPGQSETVTFAIPFGVGTDNLDSVTELRRSALALSNAQAAGALEPRRIGDLVVAPPSQRVRLSPPQPNPFTTRAVVRYAMPVGTRLRATLHDVLGRRVAVLADGPTPTPEGEIAVDGAGLAPGVYRVRVSVPAGEQIVTLVRGR